MHAGGPADAPALQEQRMYTDVLSPTGWTGWSGFYSSFTDHHKQAIKEKIEKVGGKVVLE